MSWLHHVLNHLPIAFSALAATLLVIAWARPGETLAVASRGVVHLAAASAVVTSVTGLLSAGHVVETGVDPASVDLHRIVALGGTLLAVIASGLIWIGAKQGRRGAAAPLIAKIARARSLMAILAAGAIGIAGHFGGDMLHPGLAPWSSEPHHHGPAGEGRVDENHAHTGHSAVVDDAVPAPPTELPPGFATPQAAPSESAIPTAPRTPAPAARLPAARPAAPTSATVKPPATPERPEHEHSGHQH